MPTTTTGILTNYAEQNILDLLMRKQTWTMPTCYLALWDGNPGEAGSSGAEVTTPGTNGYSRLAVGTAGSSKFAAAGSRANATNTTLIWGPSTGGPWSTASYVVLMDASTGGNMLCYWNSDDITAGTDDSIKIASGALTMAFTAGTKFTDTVLNAVLDHLVGRTSYTAPDTWLALYNGDPLGAGTEVTTAGSNGYARVDLDSKMAAASGGSIANGSTIDYGPASSSWGTTDYVAVMSALTAGSVMGGWALGSSKTIGNGGEASFAVGTLTFTLD